MANQAAYNQGQNYANNGMGAANQNNQHHQTRESYNAAYQRQKQQGGNK